MLRFFTASFLAEIRIFLEKRLLRNPRPSPKSSIRSLAKRLSKC